MNPDETFRPLPARVPPLPGESLTSLLRRTSAAMGYESMAPLVALLAERGRVPYKIDQLRPGRALDYLDALLQQTPETIASRTVHCFASSLVLLPRGRVPALVCDAATIQRYFSSAWPVCPVCLEQDQIPYERLLWSLRPIPVCVDHGCLLIRQCPACQRPLRWDRQDASRCRCGHKLGDTEPVVISPHGRSLARYFCQLLLGDALPPLEMSAAACFWWSTRLAAAIRRTPAWLLEAGQRARIDPQHHGDAISWLAAAETLADGPTRLMAFLDAFQQIDKQMTTSTGVGRRFGTLLRQAATLEKLGHPAPAMALREYLVEHYASGHLSGKVCLFQDPEARSALRKRAWISQTHAAKMLRLRHGAVARLVEEGILEGRLHSVGRRGRFVGLVHRRSVETLQAELREGLDVQATTERLGVDRHRVRDLVDGRVLPRAVRTARGWRIPQASVAYLEDFCKELPAGKPANGHWLSLREATRKFGPTGLTLAMLVELIQCQRVSARMLDPEKRLSGIVVSDTGLSALVPEIRNRRDQDRGYPDHHLGSVLFAGRPIKDSVIAKWIAAGLLKARKAGRARLVAPEEVERFRRAYCLAEEACRILGIARSTLSHWEAEGLVQPVYGKRLTPGAGFSLYRRPDLMGLSRRRRPAA